MCKEEELTLITDKLLELGRLNIVKWDREGILYLDKYKWLVDIALGKPLAVCPCCRQVVKSDISWNKIMKYIRKELKEKK